MNVPHQAPWDPWRDAAAIASHLQQPGSELLVALGAEAWCEKCQRLRPLFEALCQDLPKHVLWLWLDIEDHAEFLGNFVPPNLPLLLRWRAGQCVQASVLQDIQTGVADSGQRVCQQPLGLQPGPTGVNGDVELIDPNERIVLPIPPLWVALTGADWAC